MSDIVMIPITQLYHHPDNPRKKIGDVTELAASIEAKGIMQNLTVIPGHYADINEYVMVSKAEGVCKAVAETTYRQMSSDERYFSDGYTVVIGNRRLEASKIAGATHLPCVIRDLTQQEAMAIMLAENMQRVDLTVPEQVAGIQMCLDLGMTDEEIRKETGFSKKTYSQRKKLTAFRKEQLDHGFAIGMTIQDYLDLAELPEEEQQEVLNDVRKTDHIENSYIRSDLEHRLVVQRFETFKDEKLYPYLELIGAEEDRNARPYHRNYRLIKTWNRYDSVRDYDIGDVDLPEPMEDKTLVYTDEEWTVSLYARYMDDGYDPKAEKKEDDIRKDRMYKHSNAMIELEGRYTEIHNSYVVDNAMKIELADFSDIPYMKKDAALFNELMVNGIESWSKWNSKNHIFGRIVMAAQGYEKFDKKLAYYLAMTKPKTFAFAVCYAKHVEMQRLFSTSEHIYRYGTTLLHYLKAVTGVASTGRYALIQKLGYQLQEEELQLLDGSHPAAKEWEELKCENH